jgi:nucleoside-diphosphate-sugar epimerase
MKSCLVTGAAGFVGFHLAKQIATDNNCVVYLSDNFIRGEEDQEFKNLIAQSNVFFLPGDLREQEYISKLPNVEYVFHFAALNGTQNFYSIPFDVFDNSISSTINLVRHYLSRDLKKFIYAGTSETYADAVTFGLTNIPTSESTPIYFNEINNPRWSYAFAKTAGEVALHSASTQHQLKFLILRLHNLYGPRMGYEHVIPDLIKKQINNSGEVLGLDQARSFMYVEDAIKLIIQLSMKAEIENETFNIGSTKEISIRELASEISNLTGFGGDFIDLGAPRGSVTRRVPDTSKLESAVDQPKSTSLQDGLKKTFESILEREKSS